MGNSKKINILFVHGSLNIGGAEELRRILLKYLDKDRYEVTICCLSKKGYIGKSIEDMGYRVIEFGYTEKIYDLRNFFSILKVLFKNKFDAVQPCMFIAATFSVLPSWLMRVPVIIPEEHCREVWKKGYHKLIDKLNFGLADKIIAVSEDVKRFTSMNEGIPEEKFRVLPNTANTDNLTNYSKTEDLRYDLGIRSDTLVLGSIGRLHNQKDYPTLFASLKILKNKINNIKLLILGSGPLENQLKNYADELGLKNDILFLGVRNDIDRFFKTIDIFVLSSIYEGQPISVLEAMMLGKPIVATNVGGIPEIVKNGENGILVPSEEPEKFADAVITIFQDKGLASRMGEMGRENFLKYFSPESYTFRMESLYIELLAIKGVT